MKKRNTLREFADGNFLIRSEEFDSNKRLIKDISFEKGVKISEAVCEYDTAGNLISETQTNEDGVTTTLFEYTANKIVCHRQLFNDELFEEVRYTYNNNSVTVETYQDEELVSKLEKTENEDKSGSRELYGMDGKLLERHVVQFDAANNTYETEVYNEDNHLASKIIEKANENGKPLEVIYLNEDGKLYKRQVCDYAGDKLAEIHSTDFYADIKETTCCNEYDEKGRMISQQLFNAGQELVQNYHIIYNEKDDIIEESSIYNGGYHSVAGILNNGQSYRNIYEIEY